MCAKELPKDTLIYCLRKQRLIVARIPSGAKLVLGGDERGEAPFSNNYFEPYGVAYDSTRGGFWVADKAESELWFMEFSGSPLRLEPKEKLKFAARKLCALDFHPDHGLLVGCYGCRATPGGVLWLKGAEHRFLTQDDKAAPVSHVQWLPDGGYCYVARDTSMLWVAKSLDDAARPLTAPSARVLCPDRGLLDKLRLRYVQGTHYSRKRKTLLIADASLGAIYEVNLIENSYSVLLGSPAISDSTFKADLQDGASGRWLGTVRALAEDGGGRITFVDGETNRLFAFDGNSSIKSLGSLMPDGSFCYGSGMGMTTI